MFETLTEGGRIAPCPIQAHRVREKPLMVSEITAISRARISGKLSWAAIAKRFGRSQVHLQKTWSAYSQEWANDVRLPIDVRAYHEARHVPREDDEETSIPRRPNLDAIYSSACNALGGFPVLRLPPQDDLGLAALRARRYVEVAR